MSSSGGVLPNRIGSTNAACSGFGQCPLVGEQITALGPQLTGGVADDRGELALAQHAYRPRGAPMPSRSSRREGWEARMIP
jgi:hypothetical protein